MHTRRKKKGVKRELADAMLLRAPRLSRHAVPASHETNIFFFLLGLRSLPRASEGESIHISRASLFFLWEPRSRRITTVERESSPAAYVLERRRPGCPPTAARNDEKTRFARLDGRGRA